MSSDHDADQAAPDADQSAIEQHAVAPPADAFATVTTLLAIMADAKACGSRLRELQKQTAAAARAEASLTPALAAHNAHVARTQAELDRQKTRLDALADELGSKAARVDEQYARLADVANDLTNRETALKRRLLTLAGHDLWHETLQDPPTWEQIDQVLNPVDAHMPATGDGAVFLEDRGDDGPSEAIPDAVAGLTITRAPRQSAAERRALREAAGLR
jgi:hypothetical protein